MLKIGLVDDHRLFRKSLALLIDSIERAEVVLQAGNGKELMEQLEAIPVDLVLLDIQMPEMDGFETCKQLRKHYPDVKILIISQLTTKESIHRVMELGANGFFSKDAEPEKLEKAIKDIRAKDYFFDDDLASVIREAILWEKRKPSNLLDSPAPITRREMDIIRLACKELSSSEIADKLFINVRTVETHRKRIMEKTDSKNFIGVVLFALRHGLLLLEEL
ncbi:response regulator transcription factor [Flavobacterium amniphilum]|uniref:response regulator transcription factor n=1 Tax=Flavobacterium amniphilum TaxID=1834035 RepID=UPI00202A3230|nr:response regulator transcription factor [Flavobacterium amniphilum]MCL9807625.1 response regulator transcription factor [Flavobacterium amniphilum]